MIKITASICTEYQQLKKFCLAKIEKIEYQKTAKRFLFKSKYSIQMEQGVNAPK